MVSMNQPNDPNDVRPIVLTIELGRPGADPDGPEAERISQLQPMLDELLNAAITLNELDQGDEPISIQVANQAEIERLVRRDAERQSQINDMAANAISIINQLKQRALCRVVNVYSEERLS